MKEALEFKICDGGVNPKDLKLSELYDLLSNLEKALKNTASAWEGSSKSNKDMYISLIGLSEGSIPLLIEPSLKKEGTRAYKEIATSIATEDYRALPQKTIENLKEIQKVLKRHGARGVFRIGSNELASIDSGTKITNDTETIKGETTLYGEVQRVGGARPILRLQLDSGKTLSINLGKELAQDVASKLYLPIALKGQAEWSATTHELISFKAEEVEHRFTGQSFDKTLNKVAEDLAKYWSDVDDVDRKLNREDEDE